MVAVVAGLVGALSLGAAHTWVQHDAPDLVPRPWAWWIGLVWVQPWGALATLAVELEWGLGAPQVVWALAALYSLTGLAAWPVALHVAERRAQLADDARVGRREKAAAKVLRRATPEERARVLSRPSRTDELEQAAELARGARRAVVDMVLRERARG